jgi:hypothetical protein
MPGAFPALKKYDDLPTDMKKRIHPDGQTDKHKHKAVIPAACLYQSPQKNKYGYYSKQSGNNNLCLQCVLLAELNKIKSGKMQFCSGRAPALPTPPQNRE